MNVIDTLAQGMELAAELFGTARKRTSKLHGRAADVAEDLLPNVDAASESLHNSLDQVRDRPSAGRRALQFVAGLGIGVGASLLFTPLSGKQVREKLLTSATGAAASSRNGVTGQHDPSEI